MIVGLFCFKKDNAYYAPREDVARNMHRIHLARSHARKHDGYAYTLGERKSRTNQKRKKADETCKCEKTPEKFVKKSLLFILPHDFKKVESVQIKFLLKDLKFFTIILIINYQFSTYYPCSFSLS